MSITVDSLGTGHTVNSASSITFAHTTAGANRCLVVHCGAYFSGLTTCKYNGVTMTHDAVKDVSNVEASLYSLVAPTLGANNVVLSKSSSVGDTTAVASSWNGVNQVTPTAGVTSTNGSGATSLSLSPTTAVGDVVVDSIFENNTVSGLAVTGGQTSIAVTGGASGTGHGGSYKAGGAGSTTVSWHWDFGGTSSYVAMALKPAASGDVLRSLGMDGGMEGGLKMTGMNGGLRA